MSKLDQQFHEDRALRNAARKVLLADIEHAKSALSARGLANRVGGRVGDGAKDVFEIAKGHADDNRGVLAALIGALILWFAKAPILEVLGLGSSPEQDDEDIPPGQSSDSELPPVPIDPQEHVLPQDGHNQVAQEMVTEDE